MKLLSIRRTLRLFREKKVNPTWQFKTKGMLWRILFSDSGRIVGEDRDLAAKRASFFCLNETTGAILWSDREFEEKWWIGIEAVEDGIVYFHEYTKPDFPQHLKIIALNLETGKLLWRNDDLQFLFVGGGKVYAAKDSFDKRTYYQLDKTSGKIEREFPEGEKVEFSPRSEAGYRDLVFPQPLTEDSHNVKELIMAHCDLKKVEGSVEFVQSGNLLFFNYHERKRASDSNEPYLQNYLKVVDTNQRRLLFSELLNENVLAPTPDSFFLKGDQLFFIKNKNTLAAVSLEEIRRRA